MIIGIGTDLVSIDRIAKLHTRHDARLMRRILTPAERHLASSRQATARFLAMRFAAKEAAWKAIPDCAGAGIGWQQLEILNDAAGKPQLILLDRAAKHMQRFAPAGWRADIALSDDNGMALAFVVLSAP